MALALIGVSPVGQAQVSLTGDSTSSLPYALTISEGPVEASLGLLDSAKPTTPGAFALESFPGSPGTPPQEVTVTLSFSDSVAAGAVCGASCFEEGLNVSGSLNISGGLTTPIGGSFNGVPGSDIFAVGPNQVVIQLAFALGGTTEYLDLMGTVASDIAYCTLSGFTCSDVAGAPTAGEYINNFTVGGSWTATVSSTGYVPTGSSGRQVYLNSGSLGSPSALSWSSSANWLVGGTATTPQTGDDVFVTNTSASNASAPTVVTFDATTNPSLNSLTIEGNSSTDQLITLSQAANVLTSINETIGTTGPGEHLQTGGSNTVTGTLTINGFGTYALQAGTLNAATIQVNTGGALNLTQGGVINFAALNIAGGSVNSTYNEILDSLGQSNTSYAVTQTGGSNNVTGGSLYLGSAPGITGTYALSAGEVSVEGSLIVGESGTGNFQQNGGSVTLGSGLSLGTLSGGVGTYELSGPTATSTLSAGTEYIGENGTGTFTQTGGTNTTGNLTLAANAGATGTYNLNGGSLNAGTVQVNAGGTFNFNGGGLAFTNFNLNGGTVQASADELLSSGTFTQTAGSNTVASGAALDVGVIGTATYLLQGGTVSAQNETVGNLGTGTFTQSGGVNTIADALLVTSSSGNVASYDLQGGMLDAGTITVGTGATFKFDGGAVQFSQFNLSGGTVTAAGNELLDVPGEGGSYTFTQTGAGSMNTAAGVLVLGGESTVAGTYLLQAGTLVTGGETIGGYATGEFVQSGNGTTNTVNGNLALGGVSGNGTYSLTADSISGAVNSLTAQNENIGQNAIGQFTQGPNTANSVTGTLTIAYYPTAAGSSYALQGGTLAANAIQVNSGGSLTESVSEDASGTPLTTNLLANSLQIESGGTFTQQGGTANLGTLSVGGTANVQGGSLAITEVEVAPGGTLNQTGGTLVYSTFALNGVTSGFSAGNPVAALTTTGNELIGTTAAVNASYPTSSFTQSGSSVPDSAIIAANASSTNTVSGALVLGLDAGTTGNYTLNGGYLSAAVEEVGFLGNGNFTQTGGANVLAPYDGTTRTLVTSSNGLASVNELNGTLTVGSQAGSSGTYDAQGGQLAASVINVNAGGTFRFDGASVTFASFNLNGGAVTSSGSELLLGSAFTQSGGSNTVSGGGNLLVGFFGGSYLLQSGSISAGNESIGFGGAASFTQTGGSNTLTGGLSVGAQVAATSTYVLQGGSLAAASETIGGDNDLCGASLFGCLTGIGTVGSFTQSGSTTNTITGTLLLNPESDSSNPATYTLQGGALTTGTLQVNQGGTFNQGGGTTTVTGNTTNEGQVAIYADTFTTVGTFTSGGGAFTNVGIGSGATLIAGAYTQNSGETILTGGTLQAAGGITNSGGTIGGNGTLIGNVTVTGGAVQVGASPDPLRIMGNLTETGGTIAFEVDPNGSGGYLESTLVLNPGNSVEISDSSILFDFKNGANPLAFLTSGDFNVDTFFVDSDGSAFASTFGLDDTFVNDVFEYEVGTGPVVDLSLDLETGDLTTGTTGTTGTVPEPSPTLLALTGLGLLAIARWRRRQIPAMSARIRSSGAPGEIAPSPSLPGALRVSFAHCDVCHFPQLT
ncbi:MAG TPA: hypothetical protein VMU40_09860 [Steroidobacteraceae bacterium]|nr:hypothetical protein [Steroidobacteraceae bacterium]